MNKYRNKITIKKLSEVENLRQEVIKIFKEIYTSILSLIPEKWEKICLYASSPLKQKGEMFFYYFPKKIIKAKPVNCYEVSNKFGIDEYTYNEELYKLYNKVKEIKDSLNVNWTNVTIIIDKKTFTAQFYFNDLKKSKYTDEDRHIIWQYKYLNLPIDSFSKKNQIMISNYKEESNIEPTIISQDISDLEKGEIKNPILKV